MVLVFGFTLHKEKENRLLAGSACSAVSLVPERSHIKEWRIPRGSQVKNKQKGEITAAQPKQPLAICARARACVCVIPYYMSTSCCPIPARPARSHVAPFLCGR